MTPDTLSRIHTAAFEPERGWQAAEFETLLAQPYVALYNRENGFALTRTLAGESELLTLAVAPEYQAKGIGKALLQDWLGSVQADMAFLEVAADNAPALSLYQAARFEISGQRRGYYTRPNAASVDAILMSRVLT